MKRAALILALAVPTIAVAGAVLGWTAIAVLAYQPKSQS